MLAARLAIKDFRKDAKPFLGLSLALAAVLAPLLILMALKNGVTEAMLSELKQDPQILEIVFLNNSTIDSDSLAEITDLQGIGFIAELPRSMGETVQLINETNQTTPVTLLASGDGDPYLSGLPSPQEREIILSRRSLSDIDVVEGDTLIVVLRNPKTGEEFDVDVTLIGSSDIIPGRFALLHSDLVFAAEAVAGGDAVPSLSIPGRTPQSAARDIGRVRIFADDLANVAPLTENLEKLGYVVDSAWRRIEGVLSLERNLRLLLTVIATMSGAGFAISFALSIWVNVERKRKSLAMLRLMGAPSRDMLLFPMVQALGVTFIGCVAALALFLLVRAQLNYSFLGSLPGEAQIAVFPAAEIALLFGITLIVAILAGALGGIAIARLEPKEAMRDV